jgi:small subunit ribosomal protein S20
MANTKQAKKRAAQSDRRRARNRSVVTQVRNVVKNLRRTAETEGEKVGGLLSNTVSALDVAVRKGVLHRKTASRLKSRISKTVNKAKVAVAK